MYRINGATITKSGRYFSVVEGGNLPREIVLDNSPAQRLIRDNTDRNVLRLREHLFQVSSEAMGQLQEYSQARARFLIADLYKSQRYGWSGRGDFAPMQRRVATAQDETDTAASHLEVKLVNEGEGAFILIPPEHFSTFLGGDREYQSLDQSGNITADASSTRALKR